MAESMDPRCRLSGISSTNQLNAGSAAKVTSYVNGRAWSFERPADSSTQLLSCGGGDSVHDPVPCFVQPLFVFRSIDIALVLKDSGLSGQPHKLDCRDGVLQNDAGALHATAVIHRLSLDHHYLGVGWQWCKRSHIDDYTEWARLSGQNLLAFLVPFLKFGFCHETAKREIKS